MFKTKNLGESENGHLTIGNVDTVSLAKEYGTPLYVIDEDLIRENCRTFKSSMDKFYDGKGLICYASKAFCCKEIYRIIKDEGLGIDVASGGELFTAISVNFPTDKICFHGNNKTNDELTQSLAYGIGRIVVDNISELNRLDKLAQKLHKKAKIMLRIKPGIDAHTHSAIRTGQIDSKFGFALETGEAFDAVKSAIQLENVELKGLHCHIGSQIFDVEPFELAADVMLHFIEKIMNELNYNITELNLGGGFGIQYISEQDPPPLDLYMEKVSAVVRSTCKKLDIAQPFVIIEPGRSIVGSAGITLYTIGSIKEIPGIRTYVSIDGGMCDNPRFALYGSEYEIEIANKISNVKSKTITLAGKCCESGDLIGENLLIQEPEVGDTVAVLATGAYNYSMSSNYNRILKPAVVSVKKGKSKMIIKRETLDDIIRNDL